MIGIARGIHRRRWSPADMDTALWIDIADTDTITFNGSNVSGVADKSGNTRNLSQSTPDHQPLYSGTMFNGKQGLLFDGTDDFMSLVVFAQVYGQHVWAVVDTTSMGTGYKTFLARSGNTNSPLLGSLDYDYLPCMYRVFPSSAYGVAVQRQAIVRWGIEQAAGASITEVDSTNGVSYTAQQGMSGYWDGIAFPGQSLNTIISEILMTSASPGDDISEKIYGYLAHKWWNDAGVANTLPASHKYKNKAPML